MFDIVFAGHLTIDHIVKAGLAARSMPGGPPIYGSLTAKRMGASASIVSKVGGDFPDEYVVWLSRMGISLEGLRRDGSSLTTRYLLRYEDDKRSLQLMSRCSLILPADVPDIRCRGLHLCPVAGELPLETVTALSARAEHVSLDPQGFIRRFDESGMVSLGRWFDKSVLGGVEVYRASVGEVLASTGLSEVWSAAARIADAGPHIVIAQKGTEGSYMLVDGSRYIVPACPAREVVDTTGAGDAFVSAFMAEFIKEEDPLWCAAVGSAASSFVVEGMGPSVFGSRSKVLERAEGVSSGIVRL